MAWGFLEAVSIGKGTGPDPQKLLANGVECLEPLGVTVICHPAVTACTG